MPMILGIFSFGFSHSLVIPEQATFGMWFEAGGLGPGALPVNIPYSGKLLRVQTLAKTPLEAPEDIFTVLIFATKSA